MMRRVKNRGKEMRYANNEVGKLSPQQKEGNKQGMLII